MLSVISESIKAPGLSSVTGLLQSALSLQEASLIINRFTGYLPAYQPISGSFPAYEALNVMAN